MTLLTHARSERTAHNGARDARGPSQLAVTVPSSADATSVSAEEIEDICATRGMLEEHAARLAAQNITAKDVSALERLAASLECAVVERRTKDIAALQRQLHFTIYRAAKRRHLLQLIETLWELSARYMGRSSHPASDDWSHERYVIQSIVSACKHRDANALGLMVRYKVRRDALRLLALVDGSESHAPPSNVRARKAPKRNDVSARRSRRG